MAYVGMRMISSLVFCALVLEGQPSVNVLARTLRVQSKHSTGTIFSIDVDGREYWVTAAHILTGARGRPYGRITDKTVELKLFKSDVNGSDWLPVKFTVLQPLDDVDIVALAPTQPLMGSFAASPPASSDYLTLGGSCYFLGYALNGGWRMKVKNAYSWMPFVKRCTVSGLDSDSRLWILDGINNPGFSGGPVIYEKDNTLRFVAVISGYYTEPTEVIRGNKAGRVASVPKDTVNLNSGFILAYDISLAVDAIKKNPIGPLRVVK